MIITDGFWLIILYKNKERFNKNDLKAKFDAIESSILNRIAINYVSFTSPNKQMKKRLKDLFFEIYFDIVSQGVFYSFFYAFPRNR